MTILLPQWSRTYPEKHGEIPVPELHSATCGSLVLAEAALAGWGLLPSSGKVSDLLKHTPNFHRNNDIP